MSEASLLLLCNPENRRAQLFTEAALDRGVDVDMISYLDLLEGRVDLRESLRRVQYLRLESPGENFEVSRLLISWGLSEAPGIGQALQKLPLESGLITHTRPWYQGYSKLLAQIEVAWKDFPEVVMMNSPSAIRTMFDKLRCQVLLQEAGMRVPPLWGEILAYEHLQQVMTQNACASVFLKARYSSSASGVMAYRKQGLKEQLLGHFLVEEEAQEVHLFNSLRLHTYEQPAQIKKIINRLAQESIYAESWIPKSNTSYGGCDLRILVVGGKAYHTVLRESKSPMTNLHLGNRRGDLPAFKKRLGIATWQKIQALAEEASRAIPGAFYAGVDLMLDINLQKSYLLELNAFGDLLPNLYHDGKNTYALELDCLLYKTRQVNT